MAGFAQTWLACPLPSWPLQPTPEACFVFLSFLACLLLWRWRRLRLAAASTCPASGPCCSLQACRDVNIVQFVVSGQQRRRHSGSRLGGIAGQPSSLPHRLRDPRQPAATASGRVLPGACRGCFTCAGCQPGPLLTCLTLCMPRLLPRRAPAWAQTIRCWSPSTWR